MKSVRASIDQYYSTRQKDDLYCALQNLLDDIPLSRRKRRRSKSTTSNFAQRKEKKRKKRQPQRFKRRGCPHMERYEFVQPMPPRLCLKRHDLDSGNSRLSCSFCNALGDCFFYAFVERIWNNVIRRQIFLIDQSCDCVSSGNLHLIVDILCANVKRTAENTRECKERC